MEEGYERRDEENVNRRIELIIRGYSRAWKTAAKGPWSLCHSPYGVMCVHECGFL